MEKLIASTLGAAVKIKILSEIGEISPNDRIEYQLLLQGKSSWEKLLEEREEDGSDRTTESRRNGYWRNTSSLYRKYMEKPMDKEGEAYKRCCKILRVSPEIDPVEAEEIKIWKELAPNPLTDEKGNKKAGRPPREFKAAQLAAYETAEIEMENRLAQEEELQIEKEEEIAQIRYKKFSESMEKLSGRELGALLEYQALLDDGYEEWLFLEKYLRMNKKGRELAAELMQLHYDEEFLGYEDERTKTLTYLAGKELSTAKNRERAIREIWDKYLDGYGIKYAEWCADASGKLLELTQSDWNVFIDYHRLRALGQDLKCPGLPESQYTDAVDWIITVFSEIPSMQA